MSSALTGVCATSIQSQPDLVICKPDSWSSLAAPPPSAKTTIRPLQELRLKVLVLVDETDKLNNGFVDAALATQIDLTETICFLAVK